MGRRVHQGAEDGGARTLKWSPPSPGGVILTGPNVHLCRHLLKPPRTQTSSLHASGVSLGL